MSEPSAPAARCGASESIVWGLFLLALGLLLTLLAAGAARAPAASGPCSAASVFARRNWSLHWLHISTGNTCPAWSETGLDWLGTLTVAANRTKATTRANGANGASQNPSQDARLRAVGAVGTSGASGTTSATGDSPIRRRITISLSEDDYGRFTACHAQQMSRLSAGAGNDTFPELPDSTMGLHIFRLGLRQREALDAAAARRLAEERRVEEEEQEPREEEERKVAEG